MRAKRNSFSALYVKFILMNIQITSLPFSHLLHDLQILNFCIYKKKICSELSYCPKIFMSTVFNPSLAELWFPLKMLLEDPLSYINLQDLDVSKNEENNTDFFFWLNIFHRCPCVLTKKLTSIKMFLLWIRILSVFSHLIECWPWNFS
jgi:hypothetical protein